MCSVSNTVYVSPRDANAPVKEMNEHHFMGDLEGNFQKMLVWYDFKTR